MIRRSTSTRWAQLGVLCAVQVSATTAIATPRTVGLEWELKGQAEQRKAIDIFYTAAVKRADPTARADLSICSYERMMCSATKDGVGEPLVNITFDNATTDAPHPESKDRVVEWRRGTTEIVTGVLNVDDGAAAPVEAFLGRFFEATRKLCPGKVVKVEAKGAKGEVEYLDLGNGPEPITSEDQPDFQESYCLVPISDIVAEMNRGEKTPIAYDNNTPDMPCGGKEKDLRSWLKANGNKENLARQKQAERAQSVTTQCMPVIVTRPEATLAGILSGVATQVNFSTSLKEIADGKLDALFTVGEDDAQQGSILKAYQDVVGLAQQVAGLLREPQSVEGSPDSSRVGFWALVLNSIVARAPGYSGAPRKDAHNLFPKTTLNKLFLDTFTDAERKHLADTASFWTDRCKAAVADMQLPSSACANAVDHVLGRLSGGEDPNDVPKSIDNVPAGTVVLETRFGGWSQTADLEWSSNRVQIKAWASVVTLLGRDLQ